MRLEPNNEETTKFLEQDLDINFPPSAFNTKLDLENLEQIAMEIETSSLRDWNYRTIKETIKLFNEITNCEIFISNKKFWHYLFRGGIQGALYFFDSFHDDRIE